MNITILGTGAYGLALAIALNNQNNNIIMWTKLEKEKEEIEKTHKYQRVLPDVLIPENIKITTNLEESIKDSELIIFAIPIAFIDSVSSELKNFVTENHHYCIATKGIEQNSCMFVDEIIRKHIKTDKISVISGPSFAIDVVKKMPTGLTLATNNNETRELIENAFKDSNIKFDNTTDIYGTELCGSIKNVIAIACGILDGLKANESTKAMFLTEAINEIKLLINQLGGNQDTILKYGGIGDLLLTCTSTKSRNFTYGTLIATTNSDKINEYVENNTIEGRYTLMSIVQLIKSKNLKMPIIELINEIVFENNDSKKLLNYLDKSR